MLTQELLQQIKSEFSKKNYTVVNFEEGKEEGYSFFDEYSDEIIYESGNDFLNIIVAEKFNYKKDYELFSKVEYKLPGGYMLRINGE